jgi:uncharacterized membrane protein YedE/YeeE
VFVKAEVINWVRIQEMFRMQSFHMYGIIGTAVLVGMVAVQIIKYFGITSMESETIVFHPKKMNKGQIFGGLIFGCGWAITGACPGPIYAQIGVGSWMAIVTLVSAICGTWVYGYFRNKLPN